MPLRPARLLPVAAPTLVLFAVLGGFPYALSAVELTPSLVGVLTVARDLGGAVAVGVAVLAGRRVGGDGAARDAPGAVLIAFLLGAVVAAALAVAVVWLVPPPDASVGPAWRALAGPTLTHGVGIAVGGLAGAAVADLRG